MTDDFEDFVRRYVSDESHCATELGGGGAHRIRLLSCEDGRRFVVKSHSSADVIAAEHHGLQALSRGIRVPEIIRCERFRERSYLVLEYIHSDTRSPSAWRKLGESLASLHRRVRSELAGFERSNYIGPTVQRNTQTEDWIAFFAEHRLSFQYELARKNGRLPSGFDRGFSRLLAHLADYLPVERPFSLVHGDLWRGNVLVGEEAALVDPAPYFGHREVDVAMSELFGGFDPDFYRSYQEAFPLAPGYEQRRDLYNLYHLLNHLNIFGQSYRSQVLQVFARYRVT